MDSVALEIEQFLEEIVSNIGLDANVPIDSGDLRRSIKLRKLGTYNYQVYIDDNEVDYAGYVEELQPYWNRVAMMLAYKIQARFGGRGSRQDIPNNK